MKIFTISIISILAPFAALAQPGYENFKTDYPGKKIPFRTLMFDKNIPEGWADVTWDLSTFDTTGSVPGNVQIVDPATAPGGDKFKEANYARIGQRGQYEFFTVTNSEVISLGQSLGGVISRFTDSKVEFKKSISYEGTFTDNYSSAISTPFPVSITRDGIFTSEYDGYGTLNTPYGTFLNVIRFHTVSVETVNSPLGTPISTTEEKYSFYLPDYLIPLAEITSLTALSTAPASTITFFNPNAVTGMSSSVSEGRMFTLAPNPASNQVNYTLTDSQTEAKLTVMNSLGEIVLEKKLTELSSNINLDGFTKGVYYFNLTSEKGTESRKIVVQ